MDNSDNINNNNNNHDNINTIFEQQSINSQEKPINNNNNNNNNNNGEEFPKILTEFFNFSDIISEYTHICIVNFSFTSNDIDSLQFSLISLGSNKIVLNQTLLMPPNRSENDESLNIYKRITKTNKKFLELIGPYIASKKVLMVTPQSINLLLLEIPENFTIVDFQMHSLKAGIPLSSYDSFRKYFFEKGVDLEFNFSLVSLFTDLFKYYTNKKKNRFLIFKRKKLENIIRKNLISTTPYPFFKQFIFTSFPMPKSIVNLVTKYVEKKTSIGSNKREVEERKKRIKFLKTLKTILDSNNLENVDINKINLKELIKNNLNNNNNINIENLNSIINNNNKKDNNIPKIENNNNSSGSINQNLIDTISGINIEAINTKNNNSTVNNNKNNNNNNNNNISNIIDNITENSDNEENKKEKQVELLQFLKSFIKEEKKQLYQSPPSTNLENELTETDIDSNDHLDKNNNNNNNNNSNDVESIKELFEKQLELLLEFENFHFNKNYKINNNGNGSKNTNNSNNIDSNKFNQNYLIQQHEIYEKLINKLKNLESKEKQNKITINNLELKVESLQNILNNFKNNKTNINSNNQYNNFKNKNNNNNDINNNDNNNNNYNNNNNIELSSQSISKINPNLKIRRIQNSYPMGTKKTDLISKLAKYSINKIKK